VSGRWTSCRCPWRSAGIRSMLRSNIWSSFTPVARNTGSDDLLQRPCHLRCAASYCGTLPHRVATIRHNAYKYHVMGQDNKKKWSRKSKINNTTIQQTVHVHLSGKVAYGYQWWSQIWVVVRIQEIMVLVILGSPASLSRCMSHAVWYSVFALLRSLWLRRSPHGDLSIFTKYWQYMSELTKYMSRKKPTAPQPRQGLVNFKIRQFIKNPWWP
jgi:hypothetical protein